MLSIEAPGLEPHERKLSVWFGQHDIGDINLSMSRGTFIRNSSIVTAVAQEHGLSLVSQQSRALPANRRYLPPPKRGLSSATMDARLRREVVVVFNKP